MHINDNDGEDSTCNVFSINNMFQGEELWSTDSDDEEADQQDALQPREDSSATPLWQLIFVLLWQSVYKISKSAITVMFTFLALFVDMLGRVYLNVPLQNFADKIPINADAAQKYCGLGMSTYINGDISLK